MKRVHTIHDARAACRALRSSPEITLGLVPTMGALHEGHLSLVRAAREACSHVAVSIFVNPTQFGPGEDLDRYPRTLEADSTLLEAAGVDLLFAPSAAEMYPAGQLRSSVDPGSLGDRLDGRTRPGHFRGVATVVTKLFNILQPDRAFFGQKDAAQVAVLRAIVQDLDLPVDLTVCPIVRDSDGLALSSRNRYLTADERTEALALSQALTAARCAIQAGERRAEAITGRMRALLTRDTLRLDYLEVVHRDTLLPQTTVRPDTLIALAAFAGNTRLIDNLLVSDIAPEIVL